MIPDAAHALLPLLLFVQHNVWPDHPYPWATGGQIQKETCPSRTSPKCWNPKTEFKTSREYGFGLGQVTIAYTETGAVRFNKWAELRAQYPSLGAWTWENRFDPAAQLTALVEMMKGIHRKLPNSVTGEPRYQMALSAYNGGEGGLTQDRRLCSNTPGCNPDQWFGHVEKTSLKSKTKWQGYGESAYDINRRYVREIWEKLGPQYRPHLGD